MPPAMAACPAVLSKMITRRTLAKTAIVAGIWFAFGAMAIAQSLVLGMIRGTEPSLRGALLWQAPVWVLWAVLTPLVLHLGRRVPIVKGRIVPAVGFHLVMATVVAMLHTAGTIMLGRLLAGAAPESVQLSKIFLAVLGAQFQILIMVYWAILGAGYAVDYYRKYRDRELAASQLQAQLASAQLDALKMQLHPHFLFNTLHAVSVLIEEDPRAATRMVAQLGDFLRLTMDNMSVQEVTLKQELEFLRLYLTIEQTRFQDRLSVTYDVADGVLDAMVPSFLLQPLVENAIKHGISQYAGHARITVSADRRADAVHLTVEDSGCNRKIPPVGSWKDGIGLRTTRERLEHLYDGQHGLEFVAVQSGVKVTVRVPFHSQPAAPVVRESNA